MMQTPGQSHLWFLPYPFIALLAGCATVLSAGRWLRFVVASSAGAFAGIVSGGVIWPTEDGIAQSYLLLGAAIATLAVTLVSALAGLAGRLLSTR
jgi:hypothetical protein